MLTFSEKYKIILLCIQFDLQEKLGEVPGQEDEWSSRNDQHMGNETQQTGQTEPVKSGN